MFFSLQAKEPKEDISARKGERIKNLTGILGDGLKFAARGS